MHADPHAARRHDATADGAVPHGEERRDAPARRAHTWQWSTDARDAENLAAVAEQARRAEHTLGAYLHDARRSGDEEVRQFVRYAQWLQRYMAGRASELLRRQCPPEVDGAAATREGTARDPASRRALAKRAQHPNGRPGQRS